MKGLPLPFRYAPCLAVASWFAFGGSCLAGKDWIYGGGPLPVASAEPADAKESAELPGSTETLRQIAGMMEALAAVGWADPRGGEYRELTIPGEERTSGTGYPKNLEADGSLSMRRRIHGWLLPKAEGIEQRYAAGWDGLVYPVIEVGPPADLGADIKAALGEKKVNPYSWQVGVVPDRVALAKVVMLLRLGMRNEAAKMANRWEEAAKQQNDENRPGIYTILTTEWLGAQFSRALWAHGHGWSQLALAYLEPIPQARVRVEQEAAKLGIRLGEAKQSPVWQKDLELSFLNQVSLLIADEQRRVAENVIDRREIPDPRSVPDKTKRIALLVRDLEEVDAKPFTTKSYNEFSFDPVVKALVAEGEDAVAPLLDALASDPRLTLSIDGGYWYMYPWQPARSRIIGVEEPARAALVGIFRSRDQLPNLDVPYVNYGPMEPRLKREELAKFIRTYWENNRGKPLAERWYGMLLDGKVSPRVWAEAAENLTLKESQAVPVYGEFSFDRYVEPGELDPMRGEVLRGKVTPSISELMAKRLREAYLLKRADGESFPADSAERLARALAKWDGANELETLRWYTGELEMAVAERRNLSARGTAEELVRTYIARKEAGDGDALADFAKWVLALKPKGYSIDGVRFLAPLWVFPGNPALAEVAKSLFLDPSSPWLPAAKEVDVAWITSGAETPLVAVPEYRAMLLDQLENQLVVGSVELKPDDQGASAAASAVFDFSKADVEEDLRRAATSKATPAPQQDLRLCDQIASKLTQVRGVPKFSPNWSREKRDKAIAEISAFVRRYGARWTRKMDFSPEGMTSTETELRFPVLDHPATKEDVEKGMAIFSHDRASERRLLPLPDLPARVGPVQTRWTKARWITLEDNPVPNSSGSAWYDQEVDVWQAEETLVDGQWKRTYGVVAKNRLAEVPGEEISFEPAIGPKSDSWQVAAIVEGADPKGFKHLQLGSGAPVPVQVSLQNARGVPRSFATKVGNSGSASAKDLGMTVRLEHFAGSYEAWRRLGIEARWKPLKARGEAEVTVLPIPPEFETLQRAELLRFDLARMFDMAAPGVYRVTVMFGKGGPFEEEKWVQVPMFEVKE